MARSQLRPTRHASPRASLSSPATTPPLDDTVYREFFEHANDSCAIFTLEGVITAVNRSAEKLLGWTRAELIGHHYQRVTSPESFALLEERTRRWYAREPMPPVFEVDLVHKDGTRIPVEARTRIIRDAQGRPIRLQGIYRDIRERKQNEAQLRAREERFRSLIEHASDMIVVLAADGTVSYSSPSSERVLGYPLSTALGQSGFDFVHPSDAPWAMTAFQQLAATPNATTTLELRVRHQDQSWRTLAVHAINLFATPAINGIVINSRDITEQRQAEDEVRASETRYRIVSQSISDYAFSFRIEADGNLVVEWLTDSFTKVTGYPVADLVETPTPIYQYMHPDDVARVLATVRQLEPGTPTSYEFRIVTKAGETRWIQSRAIAVADTHGQLVRLYGAAKDITEQKAAEEARRVSEERYRTMFEVSPDLLYVTDAEGTILDANSALLQTIGYTQSDLHGHHVLEFLADTNATAVRQALTTLANGQPVMGFEVQARNAHGEARDYEINAIPLPGTTTPRQVLNLARDVTTRKHAEQQVRESRELIRQIADTMPDVLFLYDLARQRVLYCNRQISLLGYTAEEMTSQPLASLASFLHPEDLPSVQTYVQHFTLSGHDAPPSLDCRVRHFSGEWRWLRTRTAVFRRTGDGQPLQVLGVAQDITTRKRLETALQEHAVPTTELARGLRRFRKRLRLTQEDFAREFGGGKISTRNIGSYETGEITIPTELLLNIWGKGYPLEAIFEQDPSEIMNKTVLYFQTSQAERELACRLVEILGQLLTRDHATITQALKELNLSAQGLTREQVRSLEALTARVREA